MKLKLIGLVLALAVVGMFATADICDNTKLGSCSRGGIVSSAAAVLADIYESATAFYTFNEANDLGLEGNDAFVGNSADFEVDSTQSATRADNASLSQGSNVDFGFCVWTTPETVDTTVRNLVYKGAEYRLRISSNNKTQMLVWDDDTTTLSAASTASAPTAGARIFVCGWYLASDLKARVSVNDGTAAVGGALVDFPLDSTGAFLLPQNDYDGDLDAAVYYKGSIPPITSLYNSGKGKTCAAMSGAELTNRESCWEMDEDGGPYIDGPGSNDLTGGNTPTQTAGLVIEGTGDAALYLVPTNAPVATGGALGNAAKFSTASAQYAEVTDPSDGSLDPGSGVSFGFAGWAVIHTTTANKALVSKLTTGAIEGEYDSYYTGETGSLTCRFHDGTSLKATALGSLPGLNSRFFFHCRHNATSNEIQVGLDAAWSGSPVSTLGDGVNQAIDFTVAAHEGGSEAANVNLNTIVFYRAAAGGDALTDAVTTSLYNSGKGKTCADLTTGEKVNLSSCWSMTEDGGPYVDSIGSNDLIGFATPTRVAGLVERSDSGMSVYLDAAIDPFLRSEVDAISPQNATSGYTVAFWFNDRTTLQSTIFASNHTVGDQFSIVGTAGEALQGTYVGGSSINASSTGAYALDTWHLGIVWWDPSDSKLRVQLNNATPVVSSGTSTVIPNPLNANHWNIGAIAAGNSDLFVDNFLVFHQVLTSAERDTLWDSGAGTFFVAWLDSIFNGPRFAWSQHPVIRRIT